MRTVRIESDGTITGTRVTDSETGQPLDAVSVVWTADAGANEEPRAFITTRMPRVVLEGEADITERCPYCGHEQAQEAEGTS